MAKNSATGFTPEQESADPVHAAITLLPEELKLQELELQDLSRRLPVGFFLNGERLQDFDLQPYTTKHDLLLSQRTNEDLHIKIGRFLPTIIRTIGGYPIDDLAKELSVKPEVMFQRAYLADALMMILNVRLETVGADVAITDQCRRCGTKVQDDESAGYHDLGQVTVNTVLNLKAPPVVRIDLQDELVEFGNLVTHVLMSPFRSFQSKDLKGVPEDKIEMATMMHMICGMPDVPEYDGVSRNIFTEDTYKRLSLRDRDRLMAAARKLIKIGPTVGVELTCEGCRFEWTSFLPWFQLRQFCSEPASAAN